MVAGALNAMKQEIKSHIAAMKEEKEMRSSAVSRRSSVQ